MTEGRGGCAAWSLQLTGQTWGLSAGCTKQAAGCIWPLDWSLLPSALDDQRNNKSSPGMQFLPIYVVLISPLWRISSYQRDITECWAGKRRVIACH